VSFLCAPVVEADAYVKVTNIPRSEPMKSAKEIEHDVSILSCSLFISHQNKKCVLSESMISLKMCAE